MRGLSTISAAILIACAVPATSRADAPGPRTAPTAEAASPGCRCPGIRHVVRRHVRHVRHFRRGRLPVAVALAPPVPYDPPIPDPLDPAYDRAMTLHFRSPQVAGVYPGEPGFPPTPIVRGIFPYRVHAGGRVLHYDAI